MDLTAFPDSRRDKSRGARYANPPMPRLLLTLIAFLLALTGGRASAVSSRGRDAENRLTQLQTRHTASSTYPGIRLSFAYDGLSSRISKQVETTTNGTTRDLARGQTS